MMENKPSVLKQAATQIGAGGSAGTLIYFNIIMLAYYLCFRELT